MKRDIWAVALAAGLTTALTPGTGSAAPVTLDIIGQVFRVATDTATLPSGTVDVSAGDRVEAQLTFDDTAVGTPRLSGSTVIGTSYAAQSLTVTFFGRATQVFTYGQPGDTRLLTLSNNRTTRFVNPGFIGDGVQGLFGQPSNNAANFALSDTVPLPGPPGLLHGEALSDLLAQLPIFPTAAIRPSLEVFTNTAQLGAQCATDRYCRVSASVSEIRLRPPAPPPPPPPAPVPLPAGVFGLLAGLAGLFALRRRG